MLNKHGDLPRKPGYAHRDDYGGALGIRENFATNLAKLLKKKGISQAKLAEEIGLTQGSISGWITLRDWPAPENVDKVVSVLGVQPSELFADPDGKLAMPKAEDELIDAIRNAVKRTGLRITRKN